MYEHRTEPLILRGEFMLRLFRSLTVAVALILVSLLIGIIGYHITENFSLIDSFLNAAMLLGGMGPVDAPKTFEGKLFAGVYALYCGLLVIFVAGVILAPIAHRILHKLHAEVNEP